MTNLKDLTVKSLKELYQEFIDNWAQYHNCFKPEEDRNCRDFTVPDWYERYKRFCNHVAEMRLLLNDGYQLDASRDKEFLENLIFTNAGDISNAKRSRLSESNFKKLINEPTFLEALETLIKDPNLSNFEVFGKVWQQCKEQGHNDNPLRVNRVVAACTLEVSSTVDGNKFDEVFDELQSKNYIGRYSASNTHNLTENGEWFDKNLHLMKELRKEFKAELAKGEIDSVNLSIFVWELYLHIGKWK